MQVAATPCPSPLEIDFDMIIYDCNPDHRRLRVTLHTSNASTLGRLCQLFFSRVFGGGSRRGFFRDGLTGRLGTFRFGGCR